MRFPSGDRLLGRRPWQVNSLTASEPHRRCSYQLVLALTPKVVAQRMFATDPFITKPDHLQTAPPHTEKSRNDQSNESREKLQGEARIAYG